MKWTTKNRDKIEIKDMTTQHIKNCIKAIKEERIILSKKPIVDYDCWADCYVRNFIDLGNDYIKAFEEELKRRNRC